MSGRRDDSLLVGDQLDAASRLVELGGSVPRGFLGTDRPLADQVLWNLVVLGEATKRLTPAMRDRFSDVPWAKLAGIRDRVTHHYEGIDWEIVTLVLLDELPPLLSRLAEIRDLLRDEFDAGA